MTELKWLKENLDAQSDYCLYHAQSKVKIYVEQNEQYADSLRTDFEYCQSCFHRIKTFLLNRKSDLGLMRAWKIKEKVIFT